MTCRHVEDNLIEWADFTDYSTKWCGDKKIHSPHEGCMGIMCDYGCNAAEWF